MLRAVIRSAQFRLALLQRRRRINDFQLLYYYDPHTWRDTKWMGTQILKCPLDLWLYQEFIWQTKPDLLIETGTAEGGSALFFAHLMDILGNGRVITVDIGTGARPVHERITYITASSIDPHVLSRLSDEARTAERVMVVLDSDHGAAHVLAELRSYHHFVSPGGYLVVEDGNINGNPVAARSGPGPTEALQAFLAENDDFEHDHRGDHLLLSFNPGGYLRRRMSQNKAAF